jgi:hypothetical protein
VVRVVVALEPAEELSGAGALLCAGGVALRGAGVSSLPQPAASASAAAAASVYTVFIGVLSRLVDGWPVLAKGMP